MKQKHVLMLVWAVAVIAVLLLLIFWSHLLSWPESGPEPGTENGGAARTPVETVTVHRFESPDEWYVAGAVGQTYTETLSGVDLRTGERGVLLGQSPPDGPYIDWYAIGRAYAGWDTSALPADAEVLSATLVLELPASGGRKEAFDIAVYRGGWTPPIDLDDWQTPGVQAVGRWHLPASRIEERETLRTGQGITLYALEPARTVRVPLDSAVIEAGGVTRLELRHAEEGLPPVTAGVVSLGRSQIALEVEYRP